MISTLSRWHGARILTALWIVLAAARAQASLQVFPTRVVLSDKKAISHLSLRHTGNSPGRYSISAVFYRMTAEGNLELASDPKEDERSATTLIRFSPKKTTIGPNQEQVVRVIFSGPKNMAEGEYRAHIHFEPLDDPEPQAATAAIAKPGQVTMSMTARVAVAVPLIYRKGNPDFKSTLSEPGLLRLQDQTPAFRAKLVTEGKAFAFGDLHAFFTPTGTTTPKTVGVVRSVASYNKERIVQFPLTIPDVLVFSNGMFRLEFRQPDDQGGNLISFVEAPVQ